MRHHILLLLWATLMLVACGVADSSSTVGPTAADVGPEVTVAIEYMGTVGVEGPFLVDPEKITPPPNPTPLRGPTTITFGDFNMGQTLYLTMGDTFTLDSSVPGPIHIGDERIVAPVSDREGVYQALAAGQTELEVTIDPCAGWNQSMACTQPVALLILKIVVEAANEKPGLTDYKSVLSALDLPRQQLDSAFLPLDLHSGQYVGIGQDGELYLIDWASGQRTQITSDGLPKVEAVLSEQYIAWMTQQGEAAVHIFVQNRLTGEQRRITGEPAPRSQLAMDQNRLVWADKRNELAEDYTHYDIYAYDLATDTEYPIAVAPGAQQSPSIHDDLIVWQDNRNSPHRGTAMAGCENCPENRSDIYLYDFKSQTSRAIVEDEWLKAKPSVYGNRVVWQGYSQELQTEGAMGGKADLYLLELDTSLNRRLTQTPDPETSPILSQDHLLWTVKSELDVIELGPDGQEIRPETGVYVLDLNTGVVQQLTRYQDPAALFDQKTALIIERTMAGEFKAYAVTIQ